MILFILRFLLLLKEKFNEGVRNEENTPKEEIMSNYLDETGKWGWGLLFSKTFGLVLGSAFPYVISYFNRNSTFPLTYLCIENVNDMNIESNSPSLEIKKLALNAKSGQPTITCYRCQYYWSRHTVDWCLKIYKSIIFYLRLKQSTIYFSVSLNSQGGDSKLKRKW